MINTEKPPGEC